VKTVEAILNSDDPTAAAFNAGYDDPEGLNPFSATVHPRLYRFYSYGQRTATSHLAKKEEGLIWCGVCGDHIARIELRPWSGDDRYHWLCPGCGFDLLPVLSEEEYFASLGIVDEEAGNG
jgi:hypothetical protein